MLFASGGEVLQFHLLDSNSLQKIITYEPKVSNSPIKNICWSHDNIYLTILQENSFPEILCSKNSEHLSLVHCISSVHPISALCFKKNTKRVIALGTKTGDVVFYDTKTRTVKTSLGVLSSQITCMEFNYNDQQLAVLHDRNLFIYHDFNNADSVPMQEVVLPEVCTFAKFSLLEKQEIAVGCQNGLLRMWDVNVRKQVFQCRKHSADITGIAFSDKEKVIVTTGMDHKICVMDSVGQDCVFRINLHTPVTSVDISPDGQNIVTGLHDGSIYVYDIRDHLRPIATSRQHLVPVTRIAFANSIRPKPAGHENQESSTTMDEVYFDQNAEKDGETISIQEERNKDNRLLKDPFLQNFMKKHLTKVLKPCLDDLESQLKNHCDKFEEFVNSEFSSIQKAMSRWDVFSVDDLPDTELQNNSPENEEVFSNPME